MTMLWRSWATGAIASLAVFAWAGSSRAEDTLRLGLIKPAGLTGGVSSGVQTLRLEDQAETTPAGWRGGYGGGYRGYGYGGFYRPSYYGWGGYGYYRPYVSSYYYAPYYGYYPRPYYYAPPVYYYSAPVVSYSAPVYYSTPYVYYPINGGADTLARNALLNTSPSAYANKPLPQVTVPRQGASPPPAAGEGTFKYDGGPANPVPMPQTESQTNPKPTTIPAQPTVPLEGRAVSLPARPAKKLTYAAYGEKPDRPVLTGDRVIQAAQKPNR